jgi:DNA-binding response OmpR family regulator
MISASPDSPGRSAGLEGKRILVVEEDRTIALREERDLIAAGCDVIGPAQTIDDAKRLIEGSAMDAALIDGTIGGFPSYELAAALRQKDIPFAILTAAGLYRPRGAPIQPFQDAIFLDKPFTAAQLIKVVEALLQRGAAA